MKKEIRKPIIMVRSTRKERDNLRSLTDEIKELRTGTVPTIKVLLSAMKRYKNELIKRKKQKEKELD